MENTVGQLSGLSSVVNGNFAYFSFVSEHGSTIFKVDSVGGIVKWSRDTSGKVNLLGCLGGSDLLVYRSTAEGSISLGAFHTGRGEGAWTQTIYPAKSANDFYIPIPCISNDKIFAICPDQRLRAFSGQDGHELWHVPSWPVPARVGDFEAIAAFHDDVIAVQHGEIFLVNQAHGVAKWRHKLELNPFKLSFDVKGNFLAMDMVSLCSYSLFDCSAKWRLENDFVGLASFGKSIWLGFRHKGSSDLHIGRVDPLSGEISAEIGRISVDSSGLGQLGDNVFLTTLGGGVYCYGPE